MLILFKAEVRQQNFGMVSRAFIRVIDDLTNQEMCRFDLTEEASLLSSMVSHNMLSLSCFPPSSLSPFDYARYLAKCTGIIMNGNSGLSDKAFREV